jgi:putative ABC transport system permease protein
MKIGLAIRTLAKSPGFALVVILTLALGIGANTAIFSVVEAVVLAPLPFDKPDRLVWVRENSMALKREMSVSYPDFHDWQIRAGSFQEMAAVRYLGFDLTSPGTPEHVDGHQISAGFFSTLGVKPTLGREFSPQEDRHNGPPVVIISNRMWKNRFAGNPNVLGAPITLDGVGYSIIGILPSEFQLWISANDPDVYTPLGQGNPFFINDRTFHTVLCIARLKPGVTVAQASAEMSAMESRPRWFPSSRRSSETPVKLSCSCLEPWAWCCSSPAPMSPIFCWRVPWRARGSSRFAWH